MHNFAVIGSPISHSLSPAMHADFIAELGISARYFAIDGASFDGDLARIFKAYDLAGANVTLPYKVQALELASSASEAARACGAANTLIALEDGRLYAHNTDVEGFLAPLSQMDLANTRALIIGAGGAARAVKFALESRGAQISLLARRADNELGAPTKLESYEFELVINATSASLKDELPAPKELLRALEGVKIAYDLAYGHNVFLREFASRALCIDGRKMLAAQAAAAAKLFYGAAPSQALVDKWAR